MRAPEYCQVTFQLSCQYTLSDWEEQHGLMEYGVVGHGKALGDWEPFKAIRLSVMNVDTSQIDIVVAVYKSRVVQIPYQAEFEYKYLAFKSDVVEWEVGGNRSYYLGKGVVAITLGDTWNEQLNDYAQAVDGTSIIAIDPLLETYKDELQMRYRKYLAKKEFIERSSNGSLLEFSQGYMYYGLRYCATRNGIEYKEWAPGAKVVSLIGDFNDWNGTKTVCTRDEYGTFSCFIPNEPTGSPRIPHLSRVKVQLQLPDGRLIERIPAWIHYSVQEPDNLSYNGVFWNPQDKYKWKKNRKHSPPDLRIYEAHIGMSSTEEKVSTYREFRELVLPRVKSLGCVVEVKDDIKLDSAIVSLFERRYNTIQLMAIMEHAYYGSFGYHVTQFFAASSRFGTPNELKELVDTAHGLGIQVIMDVVHSHASKNVLDGLNQFDGTDSLYFHSGEIGEHLLWDSRLFDYKKYEVLRFLLSNLRWWVDEYRFDGFRFDGVTSMLYCHHGIGVGFSGNYQEYFGPQSAVDEDAICYLKLANDMLHSMDPPVVTIAEDVSGMPGLGRPVAEGGVGFDYRMGMAIPDHWIKLLKEKKDEEWCMALIVHQLLNRRFSEKTIAYAESHDQALVGDKTLAFRLMDQEMYENMAIFRPLSSVVDRGISLHKMIRLLTYSLGGEGYLNFMGNEFGHPDWIDFPREGNGFSYKHCRRQWNLVEDETLRYRHLYNFDCAMHKLESQYRWLQDQSSYVILKDEVRKLIVYEKADLLWVFNFHPNQSFSDLRIGIHYPGCYKMVLDSDDHVYGGHERLDHSMSYFSDSCNCHGLPNSIQIYSPCRTVLVLTLEHHFTKYISPSQEIY